MLTQRATVRATLSILILLFASFAPIAFAYEEINELESQDNRYDSSVTDRKAWEWLNVGGSSEDDYIGEMVVLPDGDVIISGSFKSSIVIDSCTGNMAPNYWSGANAVFVAKINKNGTCDWINTVSGNQHTPRLTGSIYFQLKLIRMRVPICMQLRTLEHTISIISHCQL
jgi:hypothetical protein